jgi:RNA-directed DNA polymerase
MRPNLNPTVFEAKVFATAKTFASKGFRPAMSAHDAIEAIFKQVCHKQKWALDADIKGCFDNISHSAILRSIPYEYSGLVNEWLKAGYVEENKVFPTYGGTPQGGVISPLLANIVLDGMERDLKKSAKTWQFVENQSLKELINLATKWYRKKGNSELGKEKSDAIALIRYADDFVIIHDDRRVIEYAKDWIESWLSLRGLTLSEEKTKIVHTTEGFDFLGQTIKHYPNNKIKGHYRRALLKSTDSNGKPKPDRQRKRDLKRVSQSQVLRITPSNKSIQKHKDAIKLVFKQMETASQEDLINRLNPIIRGWCNYHRYVHTSKVFSGLDNYLWEKLWKWAKRRHPNKGLKWVKKRYFTETKYRSWDFVIKSKKRNKAGKEVALYWHMKSNHGLGTFVKVREGKSFYDGDRIYWGTRLRKGYDNISPSTAKMLRKQDGRCAYCRFHFNNDDLMEKHHVKARASGGTDEYSNLVLLHRHCHDHLHAKVDKASDKIDWDYHRTRIDKALDEIKWSGEQSTTPTLS